MTLGLVISPPWIPSGAAIMDLNPPFLRSIIYRLSDIELLARTGKPLMLTVNNECLEVRSDWSGWEATMLAISKLPKRLGIFAVCVGNEFDLFWRSNRADVPPEFAGRLIRQASAVLRPVGIKVVATAVASGSWPEYLADMAQYAGGAADWFDLHAYGQRPEGWGRRGWMFGDLADALIEARRIAGKPVIMSEYGVKIGDAGSETTVADFLAAGAQTIKDLGEDICPLAAWFAYRDEVGAPSERGAAAFGLLSDQGNKRPAWGAYRALTGGEPMPTDPYDVGQGLRDWMTEQGDRPISHSTFLPLGRNPAFIECAYGRSGKEYRWSLVENRRLALIVPMAVD